jgi:hypothetical protein
VDPRYVAGKGIVFVFDINGVDISGPNIQDSTLYVGSNTYPLACTLNGEEGPIVCVVQGGLTRYVGGSGIFTLAGIQYSVIIPGRLVRLHQRPEME